MPLNTLVIVIRHFTFRKLVPPKMSNKCFLDHFSWLMRVLAPLQEVVKHLLVSYLECAQLREIFTFAFSVNFLKRIVKLISSNHIVNNNEQNIPNG